MTIAACYVSSEGVVLGADSATTYEISKGQFRHFNNAQKMFEVGESGSTLGIATWGVASVGGISYRHLVAELSESLKYQPPDNVEDCAQRWCDIYWDCYSTRMAAQRQAYDALKAKPNRTTDEDKVLWETKFGSIVGFCIGGHTEKDKTPAAYTCQFTIEGPSHAKPLPVERARPAFFAIQNVMDRVLHGLDQDVFESILKSPHWKGTKNDLDQLLVPHRYTFGPELPLRDAIDWIYSAIFLTIKSIKFSKFPPVCGGPIEVAVITADRPFRWVSHKGLGQAIGDHFARGAENNYV